MRHRPASLLAAAPAILVVVGIPVAPASGADFDTIDADFHTAAVVPADLDGDGRTDVVAAGYYGDVIAWWRNLGAGAWERHDIVGINGATTLRAIDLDHDGDIDLLGTSRVDDLVVRLENQGNEDGGLPSFELHVIDSGGLGNPASVDAGDLDGDGDLDLAIAFLYEPALRILMNGGDGNFGGDVREIPIPGNGASHVRVRDVDGDGDADVIAATPWDWVADTNHYWFPNDGDGDFEPLVRIGGGLHLQGAFAMDIADMNGDGREDLVVMSGHEQGNRSVDWYERLDEEGRAWSGERTIDDFFFGSDGEGSLRAADLDGDGDMDLVAGSSFIDTRLVAWINRGDAESFCRIDLQPGFTTGAVAVADLDGDGRPEVLAGSWEFYTGEIRAWRLPPDEPCLLCAGDIDDDHSVGAGDLLRLLAAWGPNEGHAADLDGDGQVGPADLAILLDEWGPC